MDFVELAKSSVRLGKKKGLPVVVEYVDRSGRSKTMALPIQRQTGSLPSDLSDLLFETRPRYE
jgi:hypothetical protein